MHDRTSGRLCVARHYRNVRCFCGVLLCLAITTPVMAKETAPLATAIGAFAKEQALAEQYASLMKTIGQKRFEDYAKGITLYATARADFNGLIEQLKQQLIQNEPPDVSAAFEAALASAVEHRIAYTTHVDQMVESIAADGQQVRGGISDYITGAIELFNVLLGAGKTVWSEYRSIKETKKKETMDQLDSLKWAPIADIKAI